MSMESAALLTSEELHQLDTLMEAQGGMRLPRLHGYLTAVISGPSLIHPDDWLPKVWGNNEAVISHPQFSISMEGVRRLYNSIRDQLEEERPLYPLLFCEEIPRHASLEKAALVQWCQGYQGGVEFTADIWNLPEHKEAHVLLLPIFITSSDDIKGGLSSFMEESALEALQGTSLDELPQIISAINAYWSSKGERQYYTIEIARRRVCPCGSGKDFEICCGGRTLH